MGCGRVVGKLKGVWLGDGMNHIRFGGEVEATHGVRSRGLNVGSVVRM
jgi:hypothetical protein